MKPVAQTAAWPGHGRKIWAVRQDVPRFEVFSAAALELQFGEAILQGKRVRLRASRVKPALRGL
jgi:hypothetical protein